MIISNPFKLRPYLSQDCWFWSKRGINKAINKHFLGASCTQVDSRHPRGIIFKTQSSKNALFFHPSYSFFSFSNKTADLIHNTDAIFPYLLIHWLFSPVLPANSFTFSVFRKNKTNSIPPVPEFKLSGIDDNHWEPIKLKRPMCNCLDLRRSSLSVENYGQ